MLVFFTEIVNFSNNFGLKKKSAKIFRFTDFKFRRLFRSLKLRRTTQSH